MRCHVTRSIVLAAGSNTVTDDDDVFAQSLQFVYVNGATLNVNRSSAAVLSTGSVCFPINRPIGAFHWNRSGGGGKLAVIGSVAMFGDAYVDREDNGKIFDVFIQYLTDDAFKLNTIDSDD